VEGIFSTRGENETAPDAKLAETLNALHLPRTVAARGNEKI
jgi:hypothetical protein